MKRLALPKILITSLIITGLFSISLLVFGQQWKPPSASPPRGNIPIPINAGNTLQEKKGPLVVETLTASSGILYLNTTTGNNTGDIERVNWVVGQNNLYLRSNAAGNGTVRIYGNQLKFWHQGEKLIIDANGEITKGRIPWTNLVGLPGSSQCTPGRFVTAIATSSITCSPGGGAITGGQNNYLARWTGPTSLATSVIYQTAGNNLAISTSTITPAVGFRVDVNGSVVIRSDLRLTKPGTPGDRQSKLIDCNGAFNLETASSGNLICGADEGGVAGAPTDADYLVYTSLLPGSPLSKTRQLVTDSNSGLVLNNPTSTASSVLLTDFNTIQKRVSSSCLSGSAISAIATSGLVTCDLDDVGIGGSGASDRVAFFTATSTLSSDPNFHLDGWSTGNLRLGIGTSSPNSTLTVHRSSGGIAFAIRDTNNATNTLTITDTGSTYMTGFQLGTTATPGYVLTTDNQGNGTWQRLGGNEGGGWTDEGTLVRLTTKTDRVDIGKGSGHIPPDPQTSQGVTVGTTTLEIKGRLGFYLFEYHGKPLNQRAEPELYLMPSAGAQQLRNRGKFFTGAGSGGTPGGPGSFNYPGKLGYAIDKGAKPGWGPLRVCTEPGPTPLGAGHWLGACRPDYAEYFPMKDVYRGNIISITNEPNPSFDKDPETPFVASKSTHSYDEKMIGIVSTLGSAIGTPYDNNYKRLALSGRLPLIVSTETGTISSGDPITSSSFKGIGMKATQKGPIVARAIDNFNPDLNTCELVNSINEINWNKETLWLDPLTEETSKEQLNEQPTDPYDDTSRLHWTKKCFKLSNGTMFGKITIVVQNSFYDPDVYLTDTGNLKIIEDSNGNFSLVKEDGSLVSQIAAFKEIIVAKIKSGIVETKKLIVDGVDILGKIREMESEENAQEQHFKEQDQKIEKLKAELEELKN